MLLSDSAIQQCIQRGSIRLDPWDESSLQPASVDVHIGSDFLLFSRHKYSFIDPKVQQAELNERFVVPEGEPFVLHPGEFVLAATKESIHVNDTIAARLEGKSSLGRLGLMCHSTAGFIDPGFWGNITLELSNVANLPIKIWPGMKIAQLCFFELSQPSRHLYGNALYGSKYAGQKGPVQSAFWKNYTTEKKSPTADEATQTAERAC